MTKNDIVNQIIEEYEGMGLVCSKGVVFRQVEHAIAYWNIWSGYPKICMIDNTGSNMIDLSDKDIDKVIYVFPSHMESMPYGLTPMWSIFGFDVLDAFFEEVAVLWYYIKGLRIYLGKDFRWRWNKPYLMITNVPSGSSRFMLYYYKIILKEEDIIEEDIIDWVVLYSKALVSIEEGKRLRKTKLIGIDLDGSELVNDGKEERDRLEQRLKDESVIFLSRY